MPLLEQIQSQILGLAPDDFRCIATWIERVSRQRLADSNDLQGLQQNGNEATPRTVLWREIQATLDRKCGDWRKKIEGYDQAPAVARRTVGQKWSDDEVFQGLVYSILSNSTDWSKVERVLPDLSSIFRKFSVRSYADLSQDDVERTVLRWFLDRRAGSMTLRGDLLNLRDSSRRLLELIDQHGSLENYFSALVGQCDGDIPNAVVALGGTGGAHKLRGLGIPLAAEFLKSIGFDVSKPDRHIRRAAGAFGWVSFRQWPDQSGTTDPTASEPELIAVMRAMASFAALVGHPVSFVDNALWLLCAKSGGYLSNADLAKLAGTLAVPGVVPEMSAAPAL